MKDTDQTLYYGRIVGVNFEPAASNFDKLIKVLDSIPIQCIDISVELKHNPLNKYDKNAIEVIIVQSGNKFMVGHIPQTHNVQILEHGINNTESKLVQFNTINDSIQGATIEVSKRVNNNVN